MPIAIVTGASRGVGRGIAHGLVENGFTVYASGRTIGGADLPGEVVRVRCDHLRDDDTKTLFRRVAQEAGSLDLLVNSAWGGYERMVEDAQYTWTLPFWEQPLHRWTSMMDVGVRAAFVAAAHAAPRAAATFGPDRQHQLLGATEIHRQCDLRNGKSLLFKGACGRVPAHQQARRKQLASQLSVAPFER